MYGQRTTNAPMTNLPIHITTHHLSVSNALRRFAREKISAVCRFANDALAADVVLRRHGGAKERFSASARLALPGRDIHGRAVHTNLYVAIGNLVAKLGRLARKRKTRLAKTFEHPGWSKTSVKPTVPPWAKGPCLIGSGDLTSRRAPASADERLPVLQGAPRLIPPKTAAN
jgi:ribosome hibernation promoting factor